MTHDMLLYLIVMIQMTHDVLLYLIAVIQIVILR